MVVNGYSTTMKGREMFELHGCEELLGPTFPRALYRSNALKRIRSTLPVNSRSFIAIYSCELSTGAPPINSLPQSNSWKSKMPLSSKTWGLGMTAATAGIAVIGTWYGAGLKESKEIQQVRLPSFILQAPSLPHLSAVYLA